MEEEEVIEVVKVPRVVHQEVEATEVAQWEIENQVERIKSEVLHQMSMWDQEEEAAKVLRVETKKIKIELVKFFYKNERSCSQSLSI